MDTSDLIDMYKFSKKIDPQFHHYPYEVYRGQSISKKDLNKLKSGKTYNIHAGSWSKNEEEAIKFALGYRDKNKIGIVFSYTPSDKDIILDLDEIVNDSEFNKYIPEDVIASIRNESEIILNSVIVNKANLYLDEHDEPEN